LLVARAPVAEIVALEDVGFLEQAYRAVDGRDADVRIDRHRPLIHALDIGMIARVREHAGDHPPLLGHFKALVDAHAFDSVWHFPQPLMLSRSKGRRAEVYRKRRATPIALTAQTAAALGARARRLGADGLILVCRALRCRVRSSWRVGCVVARNWARP